MTITVSRVILLAKLGSISSLAKFIVNLQGLMGWYMVKSGLEDRFQGPSDVPRVSQYRLAAHLSLAFILYSGLIAGALRMLRPFPATGVLTKIKQLKDVTALAHTVKAMAFITAVSGEFLGCFPFFIFT